ncbi:MAG: PAS domain S-box protein, partial [Pseudomonadota bacterium]
MSAQPHRLSEAVYRAVVEYSPVAKIMIGSDGIIVLANIESERMFGYQRDELLGQPLETLVPKSIRAKHPQMRDGFFKDPKPRFMGVGRVLSGTRKDGSEFSIEIALNPIKTEEGEFTLAAIVDITERKHADELRASSAYARSLIEASLDPLVTISAEGKITDVNEGSIKATGVVREKLIGTDFSDYFTQPDKAREGYQQVFARGFVTDYPLTIRHRDGNLTDVLYNASVYKDVAGKVL